MCVREREYIYIYIYLLIQILLLIHPSHTNGFARINPRYICIVYCGARDLSDTVAKKSPPASLIEALGAFGAAFHDRAMPADRVLHGEA
jgi:hypothetical protein